MKRNYIRKHFCRKTAKIDMIEKFEYTKDLKVVTLKITIKINSFTTIYNWNHNIYTEYRIIAVC